MKKSHDCICDLLCAISGDYMVITNLLYMQWNLFGSKWSVHNIPDHSKQTDIAPCFLQLRIHLAMPSHINHVPIMRINILLGIWPSMPLAIFEKKLVHVTAGEQIGPATCCWKTGWSCQGLVVDLCSFIHVPRYSLDSHFELMGWIKVKDCPRFNYHAHPVLHVVGICILAMAMAFLARMVGGT